MYNVLMQWIEFPPPKSTAQKKIIISRYDLNLIDSFQLASLVYNNIKLGSRIVRYRNRLGGFIEKRQLKEVYGLNASQYERIQKHVYISDQFKPRMLKMAEVDFKTLIGHPYINWSLAKLLLNYREHCEDQCSFDNLLMRKGLDTLKNHPIQYYLD